MILTVVIIIIALGILLILLEFLVIPGTTIAGIGGLLLMVSGVYVSYSYLGNTTGHYTLLGTLLFVIVSVYFALKSKTWKKMMLKSAINSKVDSIKEEEIRVGDTGITITRLNPIGKVRINDVYAEAKSLDKFVDHNTEVEVIKVLKTQIIVKLKK